MFRTPALAVATAVAAIMLAACSSGDSTPTGGTTGTGATVAKPPTPGTILSSNSTKQLGTTVLDGDLHTLYRFDKDSAKPPTATCTDSCATTWPPMLTDPSSPPVLEGVDPEEVGTVRRTDGSEQVTIGGWPVYRYAADSKPAATEGHGKDGVWFAITPTGKKAAQG